MIAKIIKKHQPEDPRIVRSIASDLAADFKLANERFDFDRFLEACGIIKQ